MKQFLNLENVDTCDICGSKNIGTYYKESDIVECLDCSFLFVSPRPSIDDIKESYSDSRFYNGWISESEGRLQMWSKRFHRIAKYLKNSSEVLDFSAGIGTFLQIVKSQGHRAYGTELSDSAKAIASKQHSIALLDTDFYFNDGFLNYFDVVTAWHVVEHVMSPRKLVTQIYKVLKTGGYLIVAVPNANAKSLKGIFQRQNREQVFPKLRIGDEIHLSQFTDDTLAKILKTVGFQIVETGIDDYYPTPDMRSRTKYYLYEFIRRMTHKNLSPTIFIVAQK
jgi:SAM-dependent methyltransferase